MDTKSPLLSYDTYQECPTFVPLTLAPITFTKAAISLTAFTISLVATYPGFTQTSHVSGWSTPRARSSTCILGSCATSVCDFGHFRLRRNVTLPWFSPPSEAEARELNTCSSTRALRYQKALRLASWHSRAAPSSQLGKWLNHDPARWDELKRRRFAESASSPAAWNAPQY